VIKAGGVDDVLLGIVLERPLVCLVTEQAAAHTRRGDVTIVEASGSSSARIAVSGAR
jgi:hypothetical protein